MRYITILNVAAQMFFTLCIFVFIHKRSDYMYVPLLSSLGYIVSGVAALRISIREFHLTWKWPRFEAVKMQLKEGVYIFVSTLAVAFYRVFPTMFLGIFHSFEAVGYYSIAEKIIRAIVSLLQPLTQSIFPFLSRRIYRSVREGLATAWRMLTGLSIVTFLISAGVGVFAGLIIKMVAGGQYNESVIMLRILCFLPFIVGLANMLGVQIMLNIRLKKEFTCILVAGGILSVILASVLVPRWAGIGASITVLVSEFSVMCMMMVAVAVNAGTAAEASRTGT